MLRKSERTVMSVRARSDQRAFPGWVARKPFAFEAAILGVDDGAWL